MIVSMWMTRELVTIGPKALVSEGAMLMTRKNIRWLLVVEQREHERKLMGLVSAEDILRAFPADVNPFAVELADTRFARLTMDEIMRREVPTTTPETPIEEAAAAMNDGKIGALPVMRRGKPIGIITESDIFRTFFSLFASEGRGARITFDATKGEDVFNVLGQFAKRDGVNVVSLIQTVQDNQPVCVVRITGNGVDDLVDDLWRSGHLVLNVLRFG